MSSTEYRDTNSWDDLMDYFDSPDKPLGMDEFVTFWASLTLYDYQYYQYALLD